MPTEISLSQSLNYFRQGVSIRTPRQYFATSMAPQINSGRVFRWLVSGTAYNSVIFDDTIAGNGPSRLGSKNAINEVVHELEIANYGQPELFTKGTPYVDDVDSEYLSGGVGGAFLGMTDCLTRLPMVMFNKTLKNPAQMDGVIEPLTIRSEIDFSAPEGSDVFYKLRASLEGSFSETIRGNTPIMQQVAFSPVRIEAFLDQGEVFGTSSQGELSLPGFIMDERIGILPFKDESIKQFRAEGVTDSGMREALMTTTGSSTESMFIHGYRSTAAGFTYVNINKFRTDSIAFGGLKK